MACGAVGLLEALGAVLADPQQPLRKASPLFAANPVQTFANRYGYCCGHRLTRALGEFLNKPIGFGVFDVKAHGLVPFYHMPRDFMFLPSPGKVAQSGASIAAEEIGFVSQNATAVLTASAWATFEGAHPVRHRS